MDTPASQTTLDVYQAILAELLTACGSDPRAYTAEALRGFVLERARRHGFWRAKTVVVAVCALLGFLGATGQVAGLKFANIDWTQGLLTMSGEGRHQERLPLSQEVGDVLLCYLRRSRPPLQTPEVFTSVVAPLRPLTRAGVTHIVRAALRRAGIKASINGARVLRHSAATTMLRQGASLAGFGAVLRHRFPRTTAHYAKVDFGFLAEITQPWPEASSC